MLFPAEQVVIRPGHCTAIKQSPFEGRFATIRSQYKRHRAMPASSGIMGPIHKAMDVRRAHYGQIIV
jgi:hypothetical protein